MPKLVLPRENLFRAVYALPASGDDGVPRALQMRASSDSGSGGNTLVLQWSVFDRFTEINSFWEGNFMERIAAGAFTKTIRENRANMRILLEHGYDPQIGNKPIASPDVVEENDIGGYAEGRLFDGLDPLVVDGLRSGAYGASFRFRVMREQIVEEPEPSDANPKGLPERTITEAQVQEFGPVTWGAYSEASAGVRSITDEMHFGALRAMPPERLRQLAEFWRTLDTELTPADAPSEDVTEDPSADERREQDSPSTAEAPAEQATPRKVERDYLQPDPYPDWFLS